MGSSVKPSEMIKDLDSDQIDSPSIGFSLNTDSKFIVEDDLVVAQFQDEDDSVNRDLDKNVLRTT